MALCESCRRGFLSRRHDFVAKTLADLTEAMKRAIFAERYAREPGLLQAIDPRVKLVTFLVLLLLAAWTRRLDVLGGLYLLTLGLAIASRIPIDFFVKRVWLFIPIFAGMVALPAIFNVVTPGKPLFTVLTLVGAPCFLPAQIFVTEQGLYGALIFILRVATSVSIAVLLVLTTRWTRLLKALGVLRFPQIGILVLGMTYRYIFLFLHNMESIFLARRSRTVGRSNWQEKERWLAASIGSLLGKSYHMSNEVYLAMVSRGWNGRPVLSDHFTLCRRDWAWLGFVFILSVLIIWVGMR